MAQPTSFTEPMRALDELAAIAAQVTGTAVAIVRLASGAQYGFATTDLVMVAELPLRSPEGEIVGSLSVFDREPRELTPAQLAMLGSIGRQVLDRLELRKRNLALAAIARDLEFYRTFFDLTMDLFATIDDELRFVNCNPAWQELLGWTLAELRVVPFPAFVHPEDLEATIAEAARLMRESSRTIDFQHRFRHKDGHWVHLSWVAAVKDGLFFASARDVSAVYKKQAELTMALEERKEIERELGHFKSTLDQTQDSIFIYDPVTLRFSYANEGASRHLGYTNAELLQMTPLDLKPPLDEAAYRKLLDDAREGASVVKFEGLHRHKDGHDMAVEVVLQYLAGPNGPPSFIKVVRDIRERKRIERAQSEFVSTVSHELRTPLTAIRGALGLVAAGITGELAGETREYVGIALANSDRLVRLINDILDIEKVQSGKMTMVAERHELRTLIQHVLTVTQPIARAQLITEVPHGDILVDRDRFTQVLTNLLSNAAKYSPPTATIDLSVVARGAMVRIAVRDRGPGVPVEFRDRMFQRFAQADTSTTREKGGTGLGLSISKALTEHMGGHIGFEPAENGGSLFFIELPLQAIAPRLLHVEHDAHIRQIVHKTLPPEWTVVGAPNLARAREALAAGAFDIVLIDLELPDGAGDALVGQVGAAAIVVFSSADASRELARRVTATLVKTRSSATELRDALIAVAKRRTA